MVKQLSTKTKTTQNLKKIKKPEPIEVSVLRSIALKQSLKKGFLDKSKKSITGGPEKS